MPADPHTESQLQRQLGRIERRLFPYRIGTTNPNVPLIRLGTEYGGWWVPESMAGPGTIAYCIGAGEDISFDLALLERGCTVRTVDPTPRAIAYVESLEIDNPGFAFAPVAAWTEDTTLRLFAPADPSHVSHSAHNLQGTSDYIDVPAKTLQQLMEDFGDTRIDLLKMDIEGAEINVVPLALQLEPKPKALCIEFDSHKDMKSVKAVVAEAKRHGYVPIKTEVFNVLFVLDP